MNAFVSLSCFIPLPLREELGEGDGSFPLQIVPMDWLFELPSPSPSLKREGNKKELNSPADPARTGSRLVGTNWSAVPTRRPALFPYPPRPSLPVRWLRPNPHWAARVTRAALAWSDSPTRASPLSHRLIVSPR